MKKITVYVTGIMMAMALTMNSYGSTFGEYEKNRVLEGTYEVCERYPNVKGLNTDAWTSPDVFGNQYRIYTYTEAGESRLVCLKHHVTRQERKAIRKNANK